MQKKFNFILIAFISCILFITSCADNQNHGNGDNNNEPESQNKHVNDIQKADYIRQKDYSQISEFISSKNNIRGLLVGKEKSGIIRISIGFKNTGYLYDPKDKQGLSELVSITLTKSNSSKKSATEIDEVLDNYASNANFTSNINMLNLDIFSMKEYFEETLSTIIQKIANIEISETELEAYKEELNTINTYKEKEPIALLDRVANNTIYNGHPLSNSSTGKKHTLNNITSKDILDFISHKLTKDPDSIIISVVGDIEENNISNILDNTLDILPSNSSTNTEIKGISKPIKGYSYNAIPINYIPQNFVYIAYNGGKKRQYDKTNAKENIRNMATNNLLSYILQKILFDEIREKKELVYHISCEFIDYKYSEILKIFFGTSNNQSEETKAMIRETIENLLRQGISEEKNNIAKMNIINRYIISLNSPYNMTQFLQKIQFNKTYTSAYTIAEYLDILEQITTEDLNNKLKEIFENNNCAIFEIGVIDKGAQEISFQQNFDKQEEENILNQKYQKQKENLTSIDTKQPKSLV